MDGIAKACCICEHFRLDMGEPGYSELTPGRDASILCNREGAKGCAWPDRRTYPEVNPMALRTIAERCALFVPHHDLVESSNV